jgi:tripartite motif-containing protein 71
VRGQDGAAGRRPKLAARAGALLAAAVAAAGGLSSLGVAASPAAGAAAFSEPAYVGSIGRPGHAGVYAWGAATARNGNVIIGDYWNYQLHEYAVTGKRIRTFGSRGDGLGQNNAPHGVAVDPADGSIYVSDLNNADIDKFAADGTPVAELPTHAFQGEKYLTTPIPYAPRLAVGPDGDSYMVNSHTFPSAAEFPHRIIVRDRQWNVQGYLGEHGDFGVLRGIAVSADNRLYVVDAGHGVVRVLHPDGTVAAPPFGSRGSAPGQFGNDIRGITVDDANGWVYVVDTASAQIEKFSVTGRPLRTWGSKGTGPGQFGDGGREITLAPDPRPGKESAPPLVVAPDFGNVRVNVYDSDGTFLWDFPNPPGLPPADGFNQAQDVAVTRAGDGVYTADTFNHRVQRFDPATGELRKLWGARGRDSAYGMNYPRGISVDPATGDVWLLNTRSGDVKVYTGGGAHKFSFGSWGTGADQLNYARGIEVTRNRAYIADSNNLRISIRDKTGRLVKNVPCAPQSGGLVLKGCTDVAVAPDGRFFAAAPQDQVVYRYAADGTLLGSMGGAGTGPGRLRGPYGLALHGDLLYVSESYNHRVSVFRLDGTFVGSFGSRGEGDAQFDRPKGIDVDASGRLYVMDHFNERVQVFQASAGSVPITAR